MPLLRRIAGAMRGTTFPIAILPPAAAVYALLAMLTPLSGDFIENNIQPIGRAEQVLLLGGFYAPWRLYAKFFYTALLSFGLAPVQQPDRVIGLWYFQASPAAYLLVLALKLPMIVFALASGILLYKLVKDMTGRQGRASVAMVLWLANPYVPLTTVMWGTWDVVALSLTVLSLMLLLRGRIALSSVSLLVGAGLKVIPIVLLPVYFVYLYRTTAKGVIRFSLTTVSLLVLGTIAALAFGGAPFSSGAKRVFELYFRYFAGVTLKAVDFELSLTVLGLSLVLVLALKFWRFRQQALSELMLVYFLVFFALGFWRPQYLLYLIAFLTLEYAISKHALLFVTPLLTAVGTSVIVFGYYFSSYGHSVFFVPNYNDPMRALSNDMLMLPGHPIAQAVGVVLYSIFTASSLYYAATLLLRNAAVQRTAG